MKRSSLMFAIVICALLSVPGYWLLSPVVAAPPAGTGKPSAWLSVATFDDFPGLEFQFITSFSGLSSGGSYTTTATTDFGGITPGLDSPTMGTWAKTGAMTTEGRGIFFSYDLDGTHTTTQVIYWEAVADEDDPANSSTATWLTEVFLPDQDPLVDDPIQVVTGTFTSRRIAVE